MRYFMLLLFLALSFQASAIDLRKRSDLPNMLCQGDGGNHAYITGSYNSSSDIKKLSYDVTRGRGIGVIKFLADTVIFSKDTGAVTILKGKYFSTGIEAIRYSNGYSYMPVRRPGFSITLFDLYDGQKELSHTLKFNVKGNVFYLNCRKVDFPS